MNTGRTLFAQVIKFLPRYEFQKCVTRYDGDRRVRSFTCWDQLLCLIFAQLTCRESLRDIVACLRAVDGRLYHMGIRGTVSRSTLADANELRDWRLYADFAQVLIREARQLYADEAFGVDLANTVYAFDSTTIDLCMSLFPWARYTRTQHAMKLHTLLDLRGNIPTFIRISAAHLHDVNVLDDLEPEAGAFYVMDRGYLDFARLYRWTLAGAYFVTRARKNFRYQRVDARPVDKTTGVQCDQTVRLVWFYSSRGYPSDLRRIRYRDPAYRQTVRLLDQQLHPTGARHRRPLSMSVAGRTVLQMDQATPAHQGLLRHVGERREDPSVDGGLQLFAGRDRPATTPGAAESLHHAPNPQRLAFRENAHKSGLLDAEAEHGRRRRP